MTNIQNPIKSGDVVVLGFPFDAYSSFMKGPALAPPKIREAFYSGSSNLCTENVTDLGNEPRFHFSEDIEINDYISNIYTPVKSVLEKKAKVISLGGDHSVTYPVLKAYSEKYSGLNILHLDAHPDLYNEYEGNPHSHACPFARIMEEKLVSRLVQVGIRTMNPHQKEQAERFRVEVIDMKNLHLLQNVKFDGPLYLSLDLDVLDPAFAPGVSHHEPGGMSVRDVITIIQSIEAPLVGADIVELNPNRDTNGITAMAAAKFLKEIADKMLSS